MPASCAASQMCCSRPTWMVRSPFGVISVTAYAVRGCASEFNGVFWMDEKGALPGRKKPGRTITPRERFLRSNVERTVLAVRRVARLAATEMSRRYGLLIALPSQQFNEPGFVFHFFVQDARRHVIGSRVLSESHVAHCRPAPDSAPFRLQQQSKNIGRGWRIGQLRRRASRLVVERRQIVGQLAT